MRRSGTPRPSAPPSAFMPSSSRTGCATSTARAASCTSARASGTRASSCRAGRCPSTGGPTASPAGATPTGLPTSARATPTPAPTPRPSWRRSPRAWACPTPTFSPAMRTPGTTCGASVDCRSMSIPSIRGWTTSWSASACAGCSIRACRTSSAMCCPSGTAATPRRWPARAGRPGRGSSVTSGSISSPAIHRWAGGCRWTPCPGWPRATTPI
mmetsp:Transcript_59392/g.140306  ORF Transcript_59392/g.140306 Transcript_59392/m.140306 type:complete len:213 (-) Transcript_59392:36-674(-)